MINMIQFFSSLPFLIQAKGKKVTLRVLPLVIPVVPVVLNNNANGAAQGVGVITNATVANAAPEVANATPEVTNATPEVANATPTPVDSGVDVTTPALPVLNNLTENEISEIIAMEADLSSSLPSPTTVSSISPFSTVTSQFTSPSPLTQAGVVPGPGGSPMEMDRNNMEHLVSNVTSNEGVTILDTTGNTVGNIASDASDTASTTSNVSMGMDLDMDMVENSLVPNITAVATPVTSTGIATATSSVEIHRHLNLNLVNLDNLHNYSSPTAGIPIITTTPVVTATPLTQSDSLMGESNNMGANFNTSIASNSALPVVNPATGAPNVATTGVTLEDVNRIMENMEAMELSYLPIFFFSSAFIGSSAGTTGTQKSSKTYLGFIFTIVKLFFMIISDAMSFAHGIIICSHLLKLVRGFFRRFH